MVLSPPAAPRRIAYLGSPDAAVAPLRALVGAGHPVVVVVSRADKRRGRGGRFVPSPVKAAALELGLEVATGPDAVLEVGADLGIVVAYGRLIKPHLLDAVPFVNLHFSLLPRWRGAAPVERAILAGDRVTGSCLMQVEETLDTGGVFRRTEVAIDEDLTAPELFDRLVGVGIADLLDALANGFGEPVPQSGEATYAHKITPDDRRIEWSASAEQIHRLVRIGGAHTTFRDKRFKLWRTEIVAETAGDSPGSLTDGLVATGTGSLRLVEVQAEGKARAAASAWLNGARPEPGERFL